MKKNGTIESGKGVAKSRKVVRQKATPSLIVGEQNASERTADHTHAPETTSIRARIDVGYGNRLFIRVEGDGLNWEKGAPMECASPSTWVWRTETRSGSGPLVFKLL